MYAQRDLERIRGWVSVVAMTYENRTCQNTVRKRDLERIRGWVSVVAMTYENRTCQNTVRKLQEV